MSRTDFDAFLTARAEAAKAYVNGDGQALHNLLTHEGEATFFSPLGDVVDGAEAVARRYLGDSRAFRPDGRIELEILHTGQSGDLAFWAGYEVARVYVGSTPDPEEMRVRVTEVFRRVAGEWKLVHRHAENLRVRLRTPATTN